MAVITNSTKVSDLIEVARHHLDELVALEAEYAGHVRLELWLEQKRKSISSMLVKIVDEKTGADEQQEVITHLANLLKHLRCRIETLQADKEPAWAKGLIAATPANEIKPEAFAALEAKFAKPDRRLVYPTAHQKAGSPGQY